MRICLKRACYLAKSILYKYIKIMKGNMVQIFTKIAAVCYLKLSANIF